MKTKLVISFLAACSMLLSLSSTMLACPPCPECLPCYACNPATGSCEWDCGPTASCCDDSCCEGGHCCDDSECCGEGALPIFCPDDQCCYNDQSCWNDCCDSGEGCCQNQCWDGLCCNDTQCDPSDTVCCGAVGCCEGECCGPNGIYGCCGKISANHKCCDNLACYNSATQKCCGYGNGTYCPNEEICCGFSCCDPTGGYPFCEESGSGECVAQCDTDACYEPENGYCVYQCGPGAECVDGECLYCWSLEEHPDGSGTCACSEATGHCGTSIQAWSISTCKPSASGSQSCGTTYRQVGSQYECDESTDWINLFLCYGGQAAECVAICAAESALCVASEFEPAGCSVGAIHCYECLEDYVEDPDDCGCLTVFCNMGDVTHILNANAGTLSGGGLYPSRMMSSISKLRQSCRKCCDAWS